MTIRSTFSGFHAGFARRVPRLMSIMVFCLAAYTLMSPTCEAQASYVACSGSDTVGGPGTVLATFTVGTNPGAICSYMSFSGDPTAPTAQDEYWLEIDNTTGQLEDCSASLYILLGANSGGGESTLFGSTPIASGSTVRVVDTSPLTDTAGVDTKTTVQSIKCAAGGSGGGAGGPPVNGGGGATSAHFAGEVQIQGPYSYSLDFSTLLGTITIGGEEQWIQPNPSPPYTASLNTRIELWATTAAYNGGTISGYKLMSCTGDCAGVLGTASTDSTDDLDTFTAGPETYSSGVLLIPPPGTYFVSILITEATDNCSSSDGYCTVAYAAVSPQLTIAAGDSDTSTSTSTSTGSGSTSGSSSGSSGTSTAVTNVPTSGSGGGGSFDWLTILLLMGISILASRGRERGRQPSASDRGNH